MDENGNDTKLEINGTLDVSGDVQADGTTTVSVEKTVTTITKTTVVTSGSGQAGEHQAEYEYSRAEDAHVYAEVYRTTTEVVAEVTHNTDQGTVDADDDYVNARELKEEVTATTRDDVTRSDDVKSGESNDRMIEKRDELEREDTAVHLTVVKTEVTSATLENNINEDKDGNNDDDDQYVNSNEVSVNVLINSENESTYDVALNVNASHLSSQEDHSPEIFEAARETHRTEVNAGNDAVYENDSEDSEVKATILNVTVTKTVTRTEAEQQQESELEIRTASDVSVTITKTEVNDVPAEHDYLVPSTIQSEGSGSETKQPESLREKLKEHKEELIRADIASETGDSISGEETESRKSVEIVHIEGNIAIGETKGELREQISEIISEEKKEVEEGLKEKALDATPALNTVIPEAVAHKVEVETSHEQNTEVVSPTGIKSPSTSGTFVLRNARQKDAMHFMQHVRNIASGQSSDLEKGEILTVLRSTSREESVTPGQHARRSLVTTGLVQQFEMASAGSGAVFPKSPSSGTLRSTSIEGKQTANNTTNYVTSDRKVEINNKEENENKASNATVVIKTTTVKGSSAGNETAQLEVKTVSVTKSEVKSSEILAKQLELKLQAKEELRKQEEQKSQKQDVTSNGIKAAPSSGESLVLPSTLSRQTSGGSQSGFEYGNQQDPRIPQWQIALKERNRSKRVSSGSMTPTSPTKANSATSPQTTPPWMTDLQSRKVKVKSISDSDESGK